MSLGKPEAKESVDVLALLSCPVLSIDRILMFSWSGRILGI